MIKKENLIVFCKRSYLPKEELKKLLLIPSILIEYIAWPTDWIGYLNPTIFEFFLGRFWSTYVPELSNWLVWRLIVELELISVNNKGPGPHFGISGVGGGDQENVHINCSFLTQLFFIFCIYVIHFSMTDSYSKNLTKKQQILFYELFWWNRCN